MKHTLKILIFNPLVFPSALIADLIKGLPIRAIGSTSVKTIKIVETRIPMKRREKI